MKKLILNPNISVGHFMFGADREQILEIIKKEFNTDCEPITDCHSPTYHTEYFENPDIYLEYKDNKLVSVKFYNHPKLRYCEVYLGNEKIWPRTEKKFLSIFGREAFTEIGSAYCHTQLSLKALWQEKPAELIAGAEGYCAEIIQNFRYLITSIEDLDRGMSRNECRRLMKNPPQFSEDGRTDCYSCGVFQPRVTSLTYDADDKLMAASHTYPDGSVLHMLKEESETA